MSLLQKLMAKHPYLLLSGEIVFVILAFISLVFGTRGCAQNKKSGPSLVCSPDGLSREGVCPVGQEGRVIEVCKGGVWSVSNTDCKPAEACTETTFDKDIFPIITTNCVSCHAGFDGYGVSRGKIESYLERVKETDPTRRMPKGKDPLIASDIQKFEGWKADGLLKSCPDTGARAPHLTLDYIEQAITSDQARLTTGKQSDARYIITTHKSDEGADKAKLREFKAGVQKSLNSLSSVRNIILAEPIDQYETIYRFFLKDVGLSSADWKLIEGADPINLQSASVLGLLSQQLAKTKKPWLHVDSFAFASNQAAVYYALLKLPAKIQDLFAQLGVDFAGDIDDFTALHVGFVNSDISLGKNRLIGRWQSDDGELWLTFDVDANKVSDDRNLLNFPLLRSASGQANYKFDASEGIATMPNGLHLYYLSNAAGDRQNAAPITVVADNSEGKRFSPEIRSSLSCYRCHNGGYNPKEDIVLRSVLENAAQFDPADVDLVQLLYRNPAPAFQADNANYAFALAKLGVLPTDDDPVNVVTDNLRGNQNAASVAAYLFLTEDEFLAGLARSADGRAQVGQLLNGGEITFQQFQASLPVLIRDLRVGVQVP